MQPIEELDIFELFDRLKNTNRILNNWAQDETDTALPSQFEETEYLNDLISNKPRIVRESWFSRRAHSLTKYLEKEDYKSADLCIQDIKYFTHCFLQDSDLGKDLRTETLKLIAETIS